MRGKFLTSDKEATVTINGSSYPASYATGGNQFSPTGNGRWQYNLKTSDYSASGTYVVTVFSGEEAEYTVEPTCEARFVRK